MTGKARLESILRKKPTDRNGFWMGDLHRDSEEIYYNYFGVTDVIALSKKLESDFIWQHADKGAWCPPDGKILFGSILNGLGKNDCGIFAECEDTKLVDDYPWPDIKNFDFTNMIKLADKSHQAGLGFVSGSWAPFFHIVSDCFGMEEYFVKMYENPLLVEALTEKIVDFYMEVNELCFKALDGKIDAYFFGNDFGSQIDLMVSPQAFKRFILPGIKRIINQAKSHNLKIIMHSCGAVSKIIPMLIDAGVDVLHPIQARANGMDAQSLAQYKNDIMFMGGVDAQVLLPFKGPDEVKEEVWRLKEILGDSLIISPSHEKILPNIRPENIGAIRDALY